MSYINKKIGIIGGGQLGKMMILEAKRLGLYVATIDPQVMGPCQSISDEYIVSDYKCEEAYNKMAPLVDVITYELEHINVDALTRLGKNGHVIYPSYASLRKIQNKCFQKHTLQERGVPVPDYRRVHSLDDIHEAGEKFGYPMMLKTLYGGYDGKGNALIENKSDATRAYAALGFGEKDLMVEQFIDFDKEISVTACRGIDGSKIIYPVAENIHSNSILDTTIVNARISNTTRDRAIEIADKVMEIFDGVGIFCVEMFVDKKGDVYVNEVAPRPHNSGHYTIEGCITNQFENHIRAVIGLPLGSADLIRPTVMVNLLGQSDGVAELIGLEEVYKNPYVRVHYYGKSHSKIGRKMGHYTVTGDTVEEAIELAEDVKKLVKVIGK